MPPLVPVQSKSPAALGSSVDLFLAITGQRSGVVKGETGDADHAGQIDISGWSWGMRRPTEYGGLNAGGLAVGTVELRVLMIEKQVDSASCAMMSMLNNNEILSNCVLSARKPGGKLAIDFFQITLTRARMVALDIHQDEHNLRITEMWTFGFDQIRVDYIQQGDDGGRRGGMTFAADSSAKK